MPSITVLDSAGVTQTVQTLPAVGPALSAASLPVVIASDQALWPATQPVSGTVTANVSGTVPVSGTFFQATQPVSIASMPSTPVTGTFFQATQPVSLTALPSLATGGNVIGALAANQSVNASQINGVTPLMGNGITGTGSLRVTIASDNTAFSVNAVQSGTWNIGSITTLPALVAGTALIGKVGIDQTTVGTTNAVSLAQIGANTILTGNGVTGTGSQRVTIASDQTAFSVNSTSTPVTPTPLNVSSAATTNATSVKASAGTLYSVVASNVGAGAAFLKLYNKASAPTVGTDVPVLTIPIAASGVVSLTLGVLGHRFATGIALAITNLVADSDTTAVAAAQVKVLVGYI